VAADFPGVRIDSARTFPEIFLRLTDHSAFDPRPLAPVYASNRATVEVYNDCNDIEVSVVMPCLNESNTLALCIQKAFAALHKLGVHGEVVIGDNGSTDGSQEIALRLGARVVNISSPGYGAALHGAIAASRGEYVIMGDSDDSYDFSQLSAFYDKLRGGSDLVMGNRFQGIIEPGAMPALHRYLGNPVLSSLGRLFFKSPVGDFHCGLRAFRREAIQALRLQTRGMEFASEMVVKATLFGLRITEVPTTLSKDGRDRHPHLRTWRDGWRHLRFLMLYSPRWLFLYPGMLLLTVGLLAMAWLLPGPRRVGHVTFDLNTLLAAAMATLLGVQSVYFAVLSKVFAITEGLLPEDSRLRMAFRYVTLETGLAAGGTLSIVGVGSWVAGLAFWVSHQFGPLDPDHALRIIVPGLVALTVGIETILSSFFLSLLGMARQ
jgi:glycosyltransferase involved in cell wall biosynthesis